MRVFAIAVTMLFCSLIATTAASSSIAAPSPPSSPIPIAFLTAKSGADPNTAKELNRGWSIFWGSRPDLAKRVLISEWDNQGSTEETLLVMRRILQSGIKIVVGIARSDEAIVASEFAHQNGMIFISPFATNPRITEGRPGSFQIGFTDLVQGRALAKFARSYLDAKRLLIVTNTASVYSTGLSDFFLTDWKSSGREFERHFYGSDQLKLDELDALIQKFKPDVVFLPDHISHGASFAKHIHQSHKAIRFLGGDGFGGAKVMAGIFGDLPGIRLYYSTHWHENTPNSVNRGFLKKYRERFSPDQPSVGSALGYDSALLVGAGLKCLLGGQEYSASAECLARISVDSTSGRLRFPEKGPHSPDKPVVFIEYQNGKHLFFKSVSLK